MSTGTLSERERRYNPLGYHLGTVWPHDNALIAAGFRRYGFDEAARQVFSAVVEAAMHFEQCRLTEVFAGFRRQEYGVPVCYPVACHPRARTFLATPDLAEVLLGLVPEAFEHRLRVVRPIPPDFIEVTFSWDDRVLPIIQLVSSSQKHAGVLSKTALNLLGRVVRRAHERIGWGRPPRSVRSTRIKRRLVLRPVDTDEWSEDAPVFLSPRRARQLGITEPPEYREQRQYVPASGPCTLKILGDNNVGLVSIMGDEVIHQLLCPTGGEVRIYTATMRMRPTTPRAPQKLPAANATGTV